jgi:GNAT superfamily N-acetyltransferase
VDTIEWDAAKHLRNKYFFIPGGMEDPYTWTFEHPDHAHLVLYQGTKIIGYTHIQFWPDNRAAMRIIVLEEDCRRKGLGSTFLAMCEKWLNHLGCTSLHVESHPNAFAFYQQNGYVDMPFNDPDGYESDPNDIPLGKVV